jgi:glycosyltransferase involved in cell wall biosynthesis
MARILILAATHEPYDNRVYYKETLSLLKRYRSLTMITPKGEDFEPAQGVRLKQFPATGRWNRIKTLFKVAKEEEVDLCHCHEPDSLLAGVWLKREKGCKLIYDSHEYHPESFSERFPSSTRGVVRWAMLRFERWMVRQCDIVITVNDDLAAKFRGWGAKVAVLPNYPSPELFMEPEGTEGLEGIESLEGQKSLEDLGGLKSPESPFERSAHSGAGVDDHPPLHLTYVGTLAKTRGVLDVLAVAHRLQDEGEAVKVSVIGVSNEARFTEELKAYARENQINLELTGHVPHDQVAERMRNSDVGMLLLHPLERYMKAEPIKLFEYMACGLPVISYHYPAVEGIMEESQCGQMIKPMDLEGVVATLKDWIHAPEVRRRLGKNGQKAFQEKYNWGVCERRLWQVYEELGL